jgi:CRISPR system Cascade subunit CasD
MTEPMREHLMFTLWAPLGAMGEIAVGERRMGFDQPGKSAVLGLLAAALGIERAAEAEHVALAAGYGLAIRVDAPGVTLMDYHTTQVPAARRNRRWATRQAELSTSELGTILSKREYRQEPCHTLALWAKPEAPYLLAKLAEALRRPTFTLYFGRKACPLGLPPAPRLIEAANLGEAFARFDAGHTSEEQHLRARLRLANTTGPVHAEVEEMANLGPGLRPDRYERRRDLPVSRRRWQFGLREEVVATPINPAPTP